MNSKQTIVILLILALIASLVFIVACTSDEVEGEVQVSILFAICIVILSIVQAYAIIKSYTFVGKWAWMFCLPIGMAMAKIVGFCGSSPFFYGISCASLAVGNIWMFGGLLIATKISESKEVNKENV